MPLLNNSYLPKMPPHLKESMNQAHLENGTYAQIDKNLEKVLALNGLETLDELETNTLSQYVTKNSEKPKPI